MHPPGRRRHAGPGSDRVNRPGEFATTVALLGLYGFVAYLVGYYVGGTP